ncbi:DUF4440 domain-containing protein [Serratia sp. M24T3]|uniref:YybH family protein n=1 Tax=Serratia sp. M24T3 TaxID=932213 RepID=UPI00025BA2F6|nr:nuclear transport factor 2 family protein [Serratia sp. M24T3]EIC85243.1 hypothetical protein SPM24T3_07379 [Serratia sp. M24T3]
MKFSKYVAVMCLCSATLATSSVMAAEVSQADLMAAAVKLGHEYDSHYAAKDPDAMAALYATDGVLISPKGPVVSGRPALHDYYVKRFASGAKGHSIKIEQVYLKGDGGYSIADFSVTVPGKNGKLHRESGKIVAIYQHNAQGWHLSLVEPTVAESANG